MTLKRAFGKVAKWVGGLTLAFASVVGIDAGIRYARDPNPVKLTEENAAYAQGYFRDKLDLSKVKIYNHRLSFLQKSNTVIVPGGNNIYVPEGMDLNKDKRLMIHELTHVCQNQNNFENTGLIGAFKTWLEHSDYKSSYYYTADTTKTLAADYNLEQQGDIMAAYAGARDWLYDLAQKSDSDVTVLKPYFNNTEIQTHLKTYKDLRQIVDPTIAQAEDRWVDDLRMRFEMKKGQHEFMQKAVADNGYVGKIVYLLGEANVYVSTYDLGGGSPGERGELSIGTADSVLVIREFKNLSGRLTYENIRIEQNCQTVLDISGGEV